MLPQAPFRRPEAKKAGEDIRAREMTSPTVDPVSRRPPTNPVAPAEISSAQTATLFAECSSSLGQTSVSCMQRTARCMPGAASYATSARNDSTNETMRTATLGFVTPPTGRRTRRISADEHDAIQARDARRRRVVQPTYCSEPSAILRSWRRMSSKFLQNEFSASRRRNARHYKMCLAWVVDKPGSGTLAKLAFHE
jgi:hypothetical protein